MDLAAPGAKIPPGRELGGLAGGLDGGFAGGLEDDVATLSYDQALRVHGRYRPAAAPPPRLVPAPPATEASKRPEPAVFAAAGLAHARRSASVTVRLSHGESERLRQRAAESGLTLSDYMRSCVLEVEQLRGQVKETLTALRSCQQNQNTTSRVRWWHRFVWRRRTARSGA